MTPHSLICSFFFLISLYWLYEHHSWSYWCQGVVKEYGMRCRVDVDSNLIWVSTVRSIAIWGLWRLSKMTYGKPITKCLTDSRWRENIIFLLQHHPYFLHSSLPSFWHSSMRDPMVLEEHCLIEFSAVVEMSCMVANSHI